MPWQAINISLEQRGVIINAHGLHAYYANSDPLDIVGYRNEAEHRP